MTLLGYVSSFFSQFSHDTIIVAPSFGFLDELKLCYLLLFSKRKIKKKKKASSEKIPLTNILTMGAPQNMIETVMGSYSAEPPFSLFPILGNRSCDHSPDDPLEGP